MSLLSHRQQRPASASFRHAMKNGAPHQLCRPPMRRYLHHVEVATFAITPSKMASHHALTCVVFASTIYLTIAFLDASSHLSPRDLHHSHYLLQSLSVSADNDSHQIDDNQLDDQGKKVRFRSRVSYCGTPFCGYVTFLFFRYDYYHKPLPSLPPYHLLCLQVAATAA